jgi:integrase
MSKAVPIFLPAFPPVTIPPADVILFPSASGQLKGRKQMTKRHQEGYVYPVGKMWYGRYRKDVPNQGKREYPSVVLGPKKEMGMLQAREKLRQIIIKEGLNTPTYLENLGVSAITFSDVLDLWKVKRLPLLKISTRTDAPGQINKHITPFFGALPIEKIKTGTINDWIMGLMKKGLAPKSIRNQWKTFQAIMNWHAQQKDEREPVWNPTLPEIPEHEQRYFTEDEARQIIDAAEGMYKVVFYLAMSSGLRFGELAGLHCEDIVADTVYVRRSVWRGKEVSTKTRKGYRAVPVDSNVVMVLKAFLGARVSGRVFQGPRGGALDNHVVTGEVLKPICKRLGIPEGGCHAFRHGRVSKLRQNSVPDSLVTSIIGHSSLRTTDGYTHFPPSFVRETIERNGLSCTQLHIN